MAATYATKAEADVEAARLRAAGLRAFVATKGEGFQVRSFGAGGVKASPAPEGEEGGIALHVVGAVVLVLVAAGGLVLAWRAWAHKGEKPGG